MPEPLNRQIDRLQEIFFSEKDPTGRAFVPLADAHRRLGELDQALEVLQEGLVAHPDSSSGHVVAGWLYRDRGEDDSAIGAFERVLELDAENGVALRSLAELVEDASRGLAYIERLVELEPDDPEVIAVLESLQAEVSARDEVTLEEPVVEAEAPAEDDPEIYTETLAELYAKQGAVGKALQVYGRLLQDDPGNGMFLRRVAELTTGVDTGPAIVPIESLAPDPEPVAPAGMPVASDDRPVVPVESLAPDTVEAMEPEPAIPVEALAPHPEPLAVVPIESLAPDGPASTSSTGL